MPKMSASVKEIGVEDSMKCKFCSNHMEPKRNSRGFGFERQLCRTCLYIAMLDIRTIMTFYGKLGRTYYYCKFPNCEAKQIFKNSRLQCWRRYGMCGKHALLTHTEDYVERWTR